MFGRLTAVRLKTAEDALGDGRIDEAFEIATSADLAGHRRVQQLLNRLFEPLLKRGQEHLMNQRFAAALADFERAARCGVEADKAAEWRGRAEEAMREAERNRMGREAAISEAQRRLAAGSLTGAEQALEVVTQGHPVRGELEGVIEARKSRAARHLSDAREALRRGAMGEAVGQLISARRLDAGQEGLAEMETNVLDEALKRAAASYAAGRLDRMSQELEALGELGRAQTQRKEADALIELAREAARAVAEGAFGRATLAMGRLAQIGPDAAWVRDARERLRSLVDQRQALLEGPLGLLGGPARMGADADETLAAPRFGAGSGAARVAAGRRGAMEGGAAGAEGSPLADGLPKRMMLRIDGAGTYLILRAARISIGRAGPGATADVQLMSDLSERHAEIVRTGEDYFLMAASGVELAGHPVEHALLQDGDRIRLGRRFRLKFLRPSLKSSSSVLELGEGVRMANDCRRVILAGGPILIGGTRECHVPLPTNSGGLILMERGGALQLKPMGPGGAFVNVAMGRPFEMSGIHLSVQACAESSSGLGRVVG